MMKYLLYFVMVVSCVAYTIQKPKVIKCSNGLPSYTIPNWVYTNVFKHNKKDRYYKNYDINECKS